MMSRALAALVIQQMSHVVDLAAMPHRRAQHLMRLLQVRHEEAAGAPEVEHGLFDEAVPSAW